MASKDEQRHHGHDPVPPLRVAMVIQQFHPIVGGAERQARTLGAALVRHGVTVTLTTARWDPALPSEENIDGISVRRLGLLRLGTGDGRLGAGISFMLRLFWHLLRHSGSYDVLHIHQALKPAVAAVAAGIVAGKPTIIKVGSSGAWNDIALLRKMKMGPLPFGVWMVGILQRCTRVVALNQSVARELTAEGFRVDQVRVMPNGVTLLSPKQHRRINRGPVRLIFVGRLDQWKGIDILLDAVVALPKTIRWELAIIGNGEGKDGFIQRSQELGLHDRVHFLGEISNVQEKLRASDIFVLPSSVEGMSNALLEAMSAGIACVTSDIPGNLTLIEDGTTGIIVPQGQVAPLRNALLRLMRSPMLRRRLGQKARQSIIKAYTIDAVAERYILEYRSLAKAS